MEMRKRGTSDAPAHIGWERNVYPGGCLAPNQVCVPMQDQSDAPSKTNNKKRSIVRRQIHGPQESLDTGR